MNVTDPISDYLTRIRNAILAKHTEVTIPYSKIKENISRILIDRKYLQDCTVEEDSSFKTLRLILKYNRGKSVINELRRMSKPGRRFYCKASDLKPVKQGYGIAIVSTSQGIFDDTGAREKNIGGEIICTLW